MEVSKDNVCILHLSTTDVGGAGKAAVDLHKSLLKNGFRSEMVVLNRKTTEKSIVEFSFGMFDLLKKGVRKISYEYRKRKVGLLDAKYNFANYDERKNQISVAQLLDHCSFNPDVIVLHWITHFLNAKTINELKHVTGARIIWNLMDMAAFTGGCHYAWNCKGYLSNCGSCPAINSGDGDDVSRKNFLFKRRYLADLEIEIIAPTATLKKQAKKSAIFKNKSLSKLLLPVDDAKFSPGKLNDARAFFNISSDKFVIFVGAQYVFEERKGFKFFYDAVELLSRRLEERVIQNMLILVAGNEQKGINLPVPVKYTGFLEEVDLVRAYQAADLFLCSSVEDSGPIMINQSIMTGTPVVCFDMGVARDLVLNGKTGFVAELFNSADLADKIESVLLLSSKERAKIASNCRELGLKELSPKVYTRKFEELLNRSL